MSIKDPKDIVCMVVDHGMFEDLAVRLSQVYKKVIYCIPTASAFPTGFSERIGYGVEGIQIVNSVQGPWFKDVDLFAFFDNGFVNLQKHLRECGKVVYGCQDAEKLETDRVYAKEKMKAVGLPVGPCQEVKGMTEMREVFKKKKNQYVKISKLRGLTETFHVLDYAMIKPKLDELECLLGPFSELQEWLVEDELPGDNMAEIGVDIPAVVDGQFPKMICGGFEVKDELYLCVFKDYDKFPECLTRATTLLADEFKRGGCRGPISNEIRIGKDHKPFVVDWTIRAGCPPSEIFCEAVRNFPAVVWSAANGIVEKLDIKYKYWAECMIESTWANGHWQPVRFPPAIHPYVSLRRYCKVGGVYSIVPEHEGIDNKESAGVGAVIGCGDSVEEAVDMCKDVANEIEGFKLETKSASFSGVEKKLAQLDELKLNFFK